MADLVPTSANEFIEQQLDERLAALEQAFDSDALCIVGGIVDGLDDLIRRMVEDLRRRPSARSHLVVVLTTEGGSIEVVQRIVDTMRRHYEHVIFVIPNYALSAGTVLALSGDEIFMDYYSRLGPIDPQVLNARTGRWVPALGYLKQWERLLDKANRGTLTLAEAQLMIDGFDQAELYQYEQARNLSIRLLREWLAKYKFKNWTETATKKEPVTQEMRERRAEEIAGELNNTDKWQSHGSGISMEVLRRDLNLLIDDLDTDPERSERVKQYYDLLSDYMMRRGIEAVLHMVGGFKPVVIA